MPTQLKQNPLWFNFFRPKDDWIEEATNLCQQHQLFKNIHPTVVRWFVSTMHPREYQQEERLFFAGDQGAGAVLLLSGEISIRHNGLKLTTIEPGDIFGEVALVNGKERTADAIATQPCSVAFLLRSDLDEWMNSRPKHACILLHNLGNMLAQRLLKANHALSEASH